MKLLGRISGSSFAIFLSFILATILLVVMGLKTPERLKQVLDAAEWVEKSVTGLGIPTEYNNWVRLFFDDAQLTMIFFVIVIRVVLALISAAIRGLFRRTLDGLI